MESFKAQQIVERLSLGTIEEVLRVSGGYSGSDVFRVITDTHDLVVKFPSGSEPATSPDDRVYGADAHNFLPAYNLLKEQGLPVPRLYGHGVLDGEEYVVMDFIDGVSVREHLAQGDVASQEMLHAQVGTLFGKMHTITRSYFGSIDATANDRFVDVFGQAFDVVLEKLKDFVDEELHTRITTYVKAHLPRLNEPKQFVLSHLDGFQGMAKGGDIVVIDIEDHQFTDQRFVLAGQELSFEIEGKQTPELFWSAYKAETSIPENYFETKDLFQLYYLVVWMHVPGIPDEGKKKVLNRIHSMLEN